MSTAHGPSRPESREPIQQPLFSREESLLILELWGILPSFKNNKRMITKDPRGRPLKRPLLITKPELQEKMEQITECLRLQLISAFQTSTGETLTGSALRSLIAYAMPEDDAWTRIPEIHLKAELCEPGKEGVTIQIRRIN